MSTAPELRILEEDHGVDAVTFENCDTGVTYLFVRPGQSFGPAVKAVLKACPGMSLSQAQDIVRTHCPSVIEMNERLGVDQVMPRVEAAPDAGVVPPVPMPGVGQHRRPRPPRWARMAAVAAPALAGGMFLAHWITPSATPGSTTPTAKAAPSLSQDDKVTSNTYRSPTFEKIADGGKLKCDPMGAYEAKCVDSDGKVMFSEASVGTSVAFTFSYDQEKVGFRLFPNKGSAEAWAAESANQELYQNVRQFNRVVLWGTDIHRLGEWSEALTEQTSQPAQKSTKADPALALAGHDSDTPLPDRLAYLAFGTLGVTKEAVHQAVQADDAQSAQLLRAVTLVLGNADPSRLGLIPSGPTDAVAIVANATTQPEVEDTRADTSSLPTGTAGTGRVPRTTDPVVTPTGSVTPEPTPPTLTPTTPTPSGGSPTPPAPPTEPSPDTTAIVPEAETTAEPPAADEPAADSATSETEPDAETETTPEPDPDDGGAEPVQEPEPAPPQMLPAPQLPAPGATPPRATELPAPEMSPAPPVVEELDGDGLSLEMLPAQWAAA
ncbi:hypothetical protein ACFUJY_29130 [Streptomyces sp. NPDC057249]|uniref:hypothetical protein n=1 Tax=Streptomyces sp. NPDC057249 TaxID=3346067 RepID=UPI003644912B